MLTREELQGQWNQVKGQIRERWAEITDDDLQKVRGNTDQLVGLIQEKTGTARKEVEKFLQSSVDQGSSMINQASESARQYAHKASENLQEQYHHVSDQVRASYEDAEDMVRSRPVESIGVAFGAGLIAGAILSLVFRSGRA